MLFYEIIRSEWDPPCLFVGMFAVNFMDTPFDRRGDNLSNWASMGTTEAGESQSVGDGPSSFQSFSGLDRR